MRHRYHWKRASMAAALGYRHDHTGTTQARLCFHLQPDSYDTDALIGLLEQLAGFYTGHKVVLLWDGLSAHWSYKMRAQLAAQRDWLTVERLPAYAPKLKPAEYLWANLKGVELANFAGDTIAEVADQAQHGIQRVCDSIWALLGQAGTGTIRLLIVFELHHTSLGSCYSAAFGYRYSGLRTLVHADGRWFLLPAGWTRDNGATVIVLPDSGNDVRVDLSP